MTSRARSGGEPAGIRTFVIADIRGYTQFTAQLGDEAASRLAAKFARICAEGFEAWGGSLLELRGDEALGVFESARQAIRAAVELQSAFADETRSEPHLPLTVGIGLDAGEAVAVGDGYRGAALNLAARLCATAAAGEIRTTESLTHVVGTVEGITFTPLEPIALKGMSVPVTPVLVAASLTDDSTVAARTDSESPTPLPVTLDSLVPFAGRARELLRVRWHWRRARHGHGRAVGILGPSGIGKTRLAAELAAEARRDGAHVVYASGSSIEDGLTSEAPDAVLLLVLDDLHRASPAALGVARDLTRVAGGRAALCLLLAETPLPEIVADAIDPAIDRITLGALDTAAIRSIVEVYAEPHANEAPIGMIEAESDGIPAAVHRIASQWARNQALARLGGSSHRAAAGRRELRAAEGELVGDVTDLERTRERARLYVTDAGNSEDAADRAGVCPYKGLATFEGSDAEYFFGRDRLVAELVAKLVGSPFVALVGASGSGKSSAVRAGLLPALAAGVLPGSDRWTQVVLRPGIHPMAELDAALARKGGQPPGATGDVEGRLDAASRTMAADERLLVVVDQFEEVFTVADEQERDRFIDILTAPRPGMKVLVALRADHYGHGAAYPALARLLAADQVLVGPVASADLGAIVERPAQRVGLRVEPELTSALVADAGQEPGALPLLSTALLELWEARTDGVLTFASYHARGGLRGAVARLAEGAFARLTSSQQLAARSVFLRLAGPGEGETVVRRRVPHSEFDTDDSDVGGVLEVMTAQRLLSTGDGYVEVAHEALLREWPRLQAWLDEDAADRTLRLHLIAAARDWDQGGRERGDLYRGARLAAVLDWAADHELDLNASERAFVDASRGEAEAESERQRRANRRLRALLVGAAAFAVVAVAAGGLAFLQADRAERERGASEQAEALARSRELAASAISYLDDDPSLSKLLALSAATIAEPPIETLSALHQAWAADRVVDRYEWPADREAFDPSAVISPSGTRLAVSGDSDYLEVLDWRTDELLWNHDPRIDGAVISGPHFSRDGELLSASVLYAAPEDDEPTAPARLVGLHTWDVETGELQSTLDIGPCGGFLVGLGETHAVVAAEEVEDPSCTEFDTPALDLVDLGTGERTRLTSAGGDAVISADGRRVAYEDFAGDSPWTYVVDTASGEPILSIDITGLDLQQAHSFSRALSPDGSLLVYGDRPIHVWDVDAGEAIASFDGHAGESRGIAFAGDGMSVYSAGRDATLRHWDARSGDELERFAAIGSGRISLATEGYAAVGREEGRSVIVDLRPRAEVAVLPTCHGFVASETLEVVDGVAALSVGECEPDGSSASSYIGDLATGDALAFGQGAPVQGLGLAPDGSRFVRQDGAHPIYGPVTVRDATTGSVIVELQGLCTWDNSLFLEPGERLPGCDAPPYPFWAQELTWSQDGSMVVGINPGYTGAGGVFVWDAVTGELILHDSRVVGSAIFTPDGRHVIVSTPQDEYDDERKHLVRIDLASGDVVADVAPDGLVATGQAVDFVGFSADGATLYLLDQPIFTEGGALHSVNAETLEILESRERVSDGSVKAHDMNGDGSRIVTGSSDGFVRVWDASTFELVHELSVADTQVQGTAFVNNNQIAIAPQDGNVYVVTIDADELISVVRSSLSRGFTPYDCERFNFGVDCPSLEELRNPSER